MRGLVYRAPAGHERDELAAARCAAAEHSLGGGDRNLRPAARVGALDVGREQSVEAGEEIRFPHRASIPSSTRAWTAQEYDELSFRP